MLNVNNKIVEYINKDTVMHLTLHNCTVQNSGTIMHLDGEDNHIDNRGSIMHNEGGRVTEARNTERLEKIICFLENANRELKKDVEDLKADLEAADRMKLLREIEELKEKVQRSESRERISRHQQYIKGYQTGVVDGSNKKKEMFDWGVRPTKEQAEALMKQLRIWLDCED